MTFTTEFFHAGRINTILGNPGEGKTNLAVEMSHRITKKGYTVLSNIAFFKPENIEKAKEKGYLNKNIKYVSTPKSFKYVPLASEMLLEACKSDRVVVFIDEAGIAISSSKALSEQVLQFKFLAYSIRKLGACLIVIAQDKLSVVPTLRTALVDYQVQVHRRKSGRRDVTFLKSHKIFDKEKGDYAVHFIKFDHWVDIPQSRLSYDSVHPGGFYWDINLSEFYNKIALSGYDSIEIREHAPRIIQNLVAEKKIDEFMKKKKFMRPGTVAEFLKVHVNTVRNWADEGKLNCIKDAKGNRLFSRSEVTKLAIEMNLI